SAKLVKVMAQVGSCTVPVIGKGFHHHGNAVGAVTFVGDGFVVVLLASLSPLDATLNVVIGNVQALGLGDQIPQLTVGSRVRTALLNGNTDLTANLGKDFGFLTVCFFLF